MPSHIDMDQGEAAADAMLDAHIRQKTYEDTLAKKVHVLARDAAKDHVDNIDDAVQFQLAGHNAISAAVYDEAYDEAYTSTLPLVSGDGSVADGIATEVAGEILTEYVNRYPNPKKEADVDAPKAQLDVSLFKKFRERAATVAKPKIKSFLFGSDKQPTPRPPRGTPRPPGGFR